MIYLEKLYWMKSRIALHVLLLTLVCLITFNADAKRKKRKKKKATVVKIVPAKDSNIVHIPKTPPPPPPPPPGIIKQDNATIKPLAQVVVSFVSRGTGIDAKARNEFFEYITYFNAKHHCELMYDKKPWGREGEIDFCFYGNNEILMPELFKDLKEKFVGHNTVFVNKNAACK